VARGRASTPPFGLDVFIDFLDFFHFLMVFAGLFGFMLRAL
jgi:hypothetical protein